MAFYYTREPGPEGQILAADGASPGRPLRQLLLAGPLPVKVALELVAYCADILTIAEEDGMVHGLLTPDQITLDERGAVSVNGWGVAHPECVAPEQRPAGPATDVYGLGVVLHGVLADQPMGDIPADRDGHDDAIVTRLTELDWQELASKRWMDEVLHFLCSMLAHDPVERPVALDVANVLGQVSAQVPGAELVPWAVRTLSIAPEEVPSPPVFEQHSPPQGAEEEEEEDLGGPEALGSPVSATSAFKLRKAASAKGEATAFWSRERIAELLADDDDEDEPVRERFDPVSGAAPEQPDVPLPDATISGMPAILPEHRPAPSPAPSTMPLSGGGSSFDAPDPPPFVRPVHPPAGGHAPQPAAPQPPPRADAVAPPSAQQPQAPRMPAGPAPAPQPPAAQPPAQPGWQPPERALPPQSQNGGGGLIQGPHAPPPGEPAKSGPNLKLVIGLLVGFILLCGGVTVVGGVGMYFWRQDSTSEAPAPERPERPETVDAGTDGADAPADGAGGTADPEPPAAEPAKASTKTKPAPSSAGSPSTSSGSRSGSASSGSTTRSGSSGSTTRSGSSGSTTRSGSSGSTTRSGSSGSTTRSGSSGSSGSAGAPDTTAGSGLPARIRFVHEGPETTLECSPGGRRSFTGSTTFDIDTVTTCRVRLEDGAMTALQLRSGGTVTCTSTPGVIRCSGP